MTDDALMSLLRRFVILARNSIDSCFSCRLVDAAVPGATCVDHQHLKDLVDEYDKHKEYGVRTN